MDFKQNSEFIQFIFNYLWEFPNCVPYIAKNTNILTDLRQISPFIEKIPRQKALKSSKVFPLIIEAVLAYYDREENPNSGDFPLNILVKEWKNTLVGLKIEKFSVINR